MQYVFLWASGTPNSRAAPGSHCQQATAYQTFRFILKEFLMVKPTTCIKQNCGRGKQGRHFHIITSQQPIKQDEVYEQ